MQNFVILRPQRTASGRSFSQNSYLETATDRSDDFNKILGNYNNNNNNNKDQTTKQMQGKNNNKSGSDNNKNSNHLSDFDDINENEEINVFQHKIIQQQNNNNNNNNNNLNVNKIKHKKHLGDC